MLEYTVTSQFKLKLRTFEVLAMSVVYGIFVFVTMFRLPATVDPEGHKATGSFSRPPSRVQW
jgi:hypothetical protein